MERKKVHVQNDFLYTFLLVRERKSYQCNGGGRDRVATIAVFFLNISGRECVVIAVFLSICVIPSLTPLVVLTFCVK